MRGRALGICATCAWVALTAAPALGADPGLWKETGRSSVPLYYYQGVTSDQQKNLYFDGVYFGLYKTDSQLNQLAGHNDEIPQDVHLREGYDHMGDLTWDPSEGGRILLPLECYYPYPGAPNSGNTCGFGSNGQPEPGTGSFGVADPATLDWRYYVKLDERDIPKAMWAEVSPDAKLVWTSSGKDLLAYSTADIKPANAAPTGPKIRPVRRLVGAVPPSGITGAAFEGERLLVAGQDGGAFQVWSIDLTTGARELQIERTIVGESEGIDTVDALGGHLHWLIQPYNEQNVPTYGVTNGTLLHFVPVGPGGGGQPPPPACCAPAPGQPSGPIPGQPGKQPKTPPARIKLTISPARVQAGRVTHFRVRTTVTRRGHTQAVPRATVHFAGKLFHTDARGRRQIAARLNRTGRREGRASKSGLRKGYAYVTVKRG
jgi:hypothetical protein